MPRRRQMLRQRGRDSRQRGFTLLELLVTLVILALSLVLIAGYRPPWSSALGLRGTVAELAAQLRAARSEAIVRNRPISVVIDAAAHRFQTGSGPLRPLPSALTITWFPVTGGQPGPRGGGIRFNPDGTATGGLLSLTDGRQTIALTVDWLTGRISTADAR